MADIPPVPFDPRQSKIHEQLVRLGPGPAAFFRDACRAFQGLIPAETAGHFAGHRLRELKSSIKNVLYPRNTKEKSDKDAIEAIAEAYGLPLDHEVVKIWPELNLDRLAHRDKLDTPRGVDEAREAWEHIQLLLSVLLDALDAAYTKVYERLDALLAKAEPGTEDLADLLGKVPSNPHTLSYFFEKVQGRGWFNLLIGSTIFDHPPPSGYWPHPEYLRRMAAEYHDEVAPVFEKILATWNYLTHHHALEAIPFFEPSVAGRILKILAQGVMNAKGHDTYHAQAIAKKAALIMKENVDGVLDVFETLLTLKSEVKEPKGGYSGTRELISPIEYHSYSEIVDGPLHAVMAAAPMATFDRLLEVLDRALTSVYAKTKPDDVSKGWLPAIEPHGQNSYHYDPLPRLGEGVRDAAEIAVTSDPQGLQQVIEKLDARQWKFLDRLALHIMSRFGEPTNALTQARALDAHAFFDYDERHEYGALLRHVYPALAANDRARILGWIREGPRYIPEKLEPEDLEYLRKSWAHLRLSWLRDYLTAEDLGHLKELEQEFGAAEESAEFSGYIRGMFSGPTSPKVEDDLRAMSVPDIVVYLKAWEPPAERTFTHFPPTREGLARQLQQITRARAGEFAAVSSVFIGIDATYVRAVIAGLDEASKESVVLDWPEVLRLCAWAVAQPREIPGRDPRGFNNDPHWGWARAAIAGLLRTGLRVSGEAKIPRDLRETLWNILLPITEDPDPDSLRAREGGDPYTTAINSTRGVAMQALVTYAGWVRGAFKRLSDGSRSSDMPEVEAILNRHLDGTADSSDAIRAIYGESLFFLHILLPGWVEEHLDELFPSDRPELADAVLHTYLAWGQYMSPDLNAILAPQFARAVATFPSPNSTAEEQTPAYVRHVGQRLVAMYMSGEIDLTGSLLPRFFAQADERTRSHVISLLPGLVRQSDDVGTQIARDRAVAFWEWRVQTTADFDLRGFGQWMESDEFNAAWRLHQLKTVLERVGAIDMDYQIVQTLARLASNFPAETLRCVRLILGACIDMMKVHMLSYRGDVARIIRAGLASGDEKMQKDATAFANELVARGFRQFRAVLDPGYKIPDDE